MKAIEEASTDRCVLLSFHHKSLDNWDLFHQKSTFVFTLHGFLFEHIFSLSFSERHAFYGCPFRESWSAGTRLTLSIGTIVLSAIDAAAPDGVAASSLVPLTSPLSPVMPKSSRYRWQTNFLWCFDFWCHCFRLILIFRVTFLPLNRMLSEWRKKISFLILLSPGCFGFFPLGSRR